MSDVVRIDHVERLELEKSRNVERNRDDNDGDNGDANAAQRACCWSDPASWTAGRRQQTHRHEPATDMIHAKCRDAIRSMKNSL